MSPDPKKNKFNAKKITINGIVFHSKKESARYLELLKLEKAGIISDLKLQVVFPLIVNEKLICKYIADFTYIENKILIVEDVKSNFTKKLPVYSIKKKLLKALNDIEIRES